MLPRLGFARTARSIHRFKMTQISKPFFHSTEVGKPGPQQKLSKSYTAVFKKWFVRGLKLTFYTTLAGTLYVSYELYKESNPPKQVPQSTAFANGLKKKELVILGTGWGAISLLKKLDTSLYNVTVVSPRSFFLFTPLLPSTPVGTIEMKSIVEPGWTLKINTPFFISSSPNSSLLFIEFHCPKFTSFETSIKTSRILPEEAQPFTRPQFPITPSFRKPRKRSSSCNVF